MASELVLPSYQDFDFACSPFGHPTSFDQEMYFYDVNDHLSYSLASPEESSAISSIPAMSVDEFLNLETFGDEILVPSPVEGLETISSEEIEGIFEWINGDDTEGNSVVEGSEWNPSSCFSVESSQGSIAHTPPMDTSFVLPGFEMEEDNQVILLHLLEAYGEAMENGEKELAAFNVLSRALPNSRFAHLTATTAILESIPDDAGTVWIVDSDMGEGMQWPPLIEAMRGKRKQLKLTSVKSQEACTSTCWKFEDTKKRLVAHARQCSVKLQIEEKSIEDICNEFMRMKKRGQGIKEWVVFNCMVGLPHMGRRRRRSSVSEFLKVAEEMLAVSNLKGIVILGEGEATEGLGTCCNSATYFDNVLRHYQVVFESLEARFPDHLAQARTAVESLFLSPFMSPEDWFQEWEGCWYDGVVTGMRLEGQKLSQENFCAAMKIANDGGGFYKVKIEGNEMVLQWKETDLVRVTTWSCM